MNSLLLNPIPIGVFISNKDGGSFKLERKNHKEGGGNTPFPSMVIGLINCFCKLGKSLISPKKCNISKDQFQDVKNTFRKNSLKRRM